jgi:hypothetical protein
MSSSYLNATNNYSNASDLVICEATDLPLNPMFRLLFKSSYSSSSGIEIVAKQTDRSVLKMNDLSGLMQTNPGLKDTVSYHLLRYMKITVTEKEIQTNENETQNEMSQSNGFSLQYKSLSPGQVIDGSQSPT